MNATFDEAMDFVEYRLRTKDARHGAFYAIALLVFCSSANAETIKNPPADEAIPLVTLDVERNGKEASGPFTLIVTVANTLSAPIVLKKMRPILPASVDKRGSKGTSVENWRTISFNQPTLAAGTKVVRRIRVPEAQPYSFAMLSFVASTQGTGVNLSYGLEDLNQGPREIDSIVPVEWEGNLLGKVFGGLLGCSALALFLASREISGKPLSVDSIYAFAGCFLSTFGLGIATVVAATLLIAFLAPADLPIKFSIKDWRGGAVLGLFSVPMGRWLIEKLK